MGCPCARASERGDGAVCPGCHEDINARGDRQVRLTFNISSNFKKLISKFKPGLQGVEREPLSNVAMVSNQSESGEGNNLL